MQDLLTDIRACTQCATDLSHGVRPVLQASKQSKVLIVGQAPGRRVHESGVPFDDPSGERLREWLGISRSVFYDPEEIAIVPMGFCYPGTGKSGDLPPRPECAPLWRKILLAQLTSVQLTVVIGRYAVDWHLPQFKGQPLTDSVAAWQSLLPRSIALPHPSPRNNIWLKKHPWFEGEVVSALQKAVQKALS